MATVTPAAARHYRRIQHLQVLAVESARRAWATVDVAHVYDSWRPAAAQYEQVLSSTMTRAANSGAEYGVTDLAERGTYVPPREFVNPAAFGSTAPSGVPLASTLTAPARATVTALAVGYAQEAALTVGLSVLVRLTRTFVADTARQAASVDIVTRPSVGYVRMINPPSCKDCIQLAGRFYRWNAGFRRHPRCDCIHRSTTSLAAAKSEGLVDDPYDYFQSLTVAEQNKLYGLDDAEAIRNGADMSRVVNARRGRSGLFTAEGTSARGYAEALRGRRLTPEGIFRTANSRTEAIDLLREHHYLLPQGQVSGGAILGPNYVGYGALGRGGTRKGASATVTQALETGVRNPLSRPTMTEAERRIFDSKTRWETAVSGRDPYVRIATPATPEVIAKAELEYRRWLSTGGEIYTS